MTRDEEEAFIYLEYNLGVIKGITQDYRVKHSIEQCLEARRKLLELSLELHQCDSTGTREESFKKAYNQFRRGGRLSEI